MKLFVIRQKDGKLSEVKKNYPHSDMIEIDDYNIPQKTLWIKLRIGTASVIFDSSLVDKINDAIKAYKF